MKFKLIEKGNPQQPSAPKKWYPGAVNAGKFTVKDFVLLTVICLLSVVTANAQTSGVEGDNLTWTLSADGTLTISGTGAVPCDASWYYWYYQGSIKKIVIEDGITHIDGWAFSYYYGLTSVVLPNTLTTIGDNAFFYCTDLTYITIPGSVTSIGKSAFSSCKKLTGFAVETENSHYRTIDGVLFNAARTNLLCYPIGKPETFYTVPDEVRHIEANAFSECVGLTSIFLPNSLETIGEGAFGYNPQLTSLVIPNSVTSIGAMAFWICEGLSHITIPESVKSIGYQAFDHCTGLKSVTVLWPEPSLVAIQLSDPFDHLTKSEIRLYVPAGTESKYRNIGVWYGFDIKEGNENNHPTLSSLAVSRGSLYPAFTQSCTSYTVSVGNSVNAITLSAAPYPLTATVSGDGEKTLAPGENTFNIAVTSESGETQTYTVNVLRLPGEYAFREDGFTNRTSYVSFDTGDFNVIFGRNMYYILETFNVSGNLTFDFDFGSGIACNRTIAVQPDCRYKITLNLLTNPRIDGNITLITPYDAYGNPGVPYIKYPWHDYVLTVSEGSNLLSASAITFPGALTSASVSVVPDGSSGINSVESGSLRVYPNPATENIRISGIGGKAAVVLFDINGRTVFNGNIAEQELIPVGHLPAGVYIVKVGNRAMKFVKNN